MWFEGFERLRKENEKMAARLYGIDRNLIGWGDQEKGITKWEEGFRAPLCDIQETDNNVIASIEVPGARKEDIDLEVSNDELEVTVERKSEKERKEKEGYTYASTSTSYYRRIPLPVETESEKATATYRDGMLRIEIPKSERRKTNWKKVEIAS